MSCPLAGRTVVVTRPAAQAEALCCAIAAAGGSAFRFPVLEIVPVTDAAVFAPVAARLDEFDVAFFVSPNAVECGLAGLQAARSWPTRLKVATVGRGSAQALRAHGFREVIAPESGFDSEAALDLPAFAPEAVRGRRVLVVRGDGGRELFGETLVMRGAHVEYLSCYHRQCPVLDPGPLLVQAARGGINALSLTSSEGVDNFVRLVGAEGRATFATVPVFAPHPRIAGRCRLHGLERIVMVGNGDEALLRALVAFFG
jgi:uroporphyrinogen-III synthase